MCEQQARHPAAFAETRNEHARGIQIYFAGELIAHFGERLLFELQRFRGVGKGAVVAWRHADDDEIAVAGVFAHHAEVGLPAGPWIEKDGGPFLASGPIFRQKDARGQRQIGAGERLLGAGFPIGGESQRWQNQEEEHRAHAGSVAEWRVQPSRQ